MQPVVHRYTSRRFGFIGIVGLLVSVFTASGCPGTLDPAVLKMATGEGGSPGTGGSPGAGGGIGTGGSTGTGGGTGTGGSNCTGSNDGATIIVSTCAVSGCHDSSGASFSGGLNLTVDSTIGSRLVGAMAGTAAEGSLCTGQGPYLAARSNPATGLLIDKLGTASTCGSQMPFLGTPLSTQQQTCLIQWATTLTSP
jgi:hypothetical protein